MRHRKTRDVIADFRGWAKENGFRLVRDSGKGKGSHQALIFIDEKSDAPVSLTLAGHDEVSPGVQGRVIERIEAFGVNAKEERARVAARKVASFLKAYFNS